ncbi:SDR family oxidoreductase [Vineibacter terrae]|uniref:SDR family oxidoreductase n=1 Tax=Vineibacter terrae TaxID=2586908 RepID=A0A5C8PC67_9HYPH|nr:SDR family oxidoreductase [Vineibacter terrae]TXL71301.1 SDR family oxidoreductase [Vineibacter terrae]
MKLAGKVAIVTGAAGGIGAAMAKRFAREGAKGVVVADLHQGPLDALAKEIGGLAVPCDVAKEVDILALVTRAEERFGPVDVFCSNAGLVRSGDEDAPDGDWALNWSVHVMSHVYAARAVAKKMAERGSGYIVNTASAAGLLTSLPSATYAVTKHAAVAFAEWLAITYGDKGVKVSVLCPQAVRTAMIQGREAGSASVDGIIEPDELAECVVRTMDEEKFLILPHPQVLDYMRRKTADYDRWLAGMRRLRGKMLGE